MLDVTAIGVQPVQRGGIMLDVGDRLTERITVGGAAMALDTVRVSALRDAGAGGPVHAIPGEAVRNLPLLDRDFVGLLGMAPQVKANLSIDGQNFRLNAIQVDGGSGGDFFGVNATPGAGAGGRSLPLEAIDELRIVIAPSMFGKADSPAG